MQKQITNLLQVFRRKFALLLFPPQVKKFSNLVILKELDHKTGLSKITAKAIKRSADKTRTIIIKVFSFLVLYFS